MNLQVETLKTFREIRRAGVRAVFSRRWFGRAMFATAVFCAVQSLVAGCFDAVRRSGFSSWSDFARARLQSLAAGLDLSVPSRAVALHMTSASAFETFIGMIFSGIICFGMSAFALRMVRDDDAGGYTAGAFGGFARPLGLAWLAFRQQLQIALWSMLLLFPGVIAYYRYRAAWYLKAENPDWSAGKCLAESARIMRGNKARCFALDCSYWLMLSLIVVLAAVLLVALSVSVSPLGALLSAVVVFLMAALGWCVFAGQTIFYISISTEKKETPSA